MSVDIEKSSVSVLTYRMLHAPVYMEAKWGCQRLRPSGWLQGQRSCKETEGEQLRAAAYSLAAWLRALFVGGRTEPTDCLFFVFLHHSRLPTRLLSSWLIQSEGAPVDGVDVNHPSVCGWRPTPWGEAEDVNWKWPDLIWAVDFYSLEFALHLRIFSHWHTALLRCSRRSAQLQYCWQIGWAVLMLDSDTTVAASFFQLHLNSFLIMTIIIVILLGDVQACLCRKRNKKKTKLQHKSREKGLV